MSTPTSAPDVYSAYAVPDPYITGRAAQRRKSLLDKQTARDRQLLSDGLEQFEAKMHMRYQRSASRLVVGALAVIMLCIGLFVFEQLRPPDIAAYADTPIVLTGLADTDIVITPRQLAEMDCESVSVLGVGRGGLGQSKASSLSAYGPTLATVLESLGYEQKDIRKVVVECKDDYTVVLRRSVLQDETVYLSIARGKRALYEDQMPMRIVVPSEDTGQWSYGVVNMRFTLMDEMPDTMPIGNKSDTASDTATQGSGVNTTTQGSGTTFGDLYLQDSKGKKG